MEYFIHILIMIGIYSLIAYSLNLVMGYCGLLMLASAAFYGIGAYTFTLITTKLQVPLFRESFFIPLLVSVLITGLLAFLAGFPALKFRKDSFVLVTLGFQIIIFTILKNWVSLTGGPKGITGISRPTLFGMWRLEGYFEFFMFIVFMNAVVLFFLFVLYQSPFGLSLKALRDNEVGAISLGKSVFHQFLWAFTITGALMAIPGALYASYNTYIAPDSFSLNESILHVVIISLGGSGNRKGPIVGVIFIILLPEILRLLNLPDTIAATARQMIYGAILVILMFLRPRGILGDIKPK